MRLIHRFERVVAQHEEAPVVACIPIQGSWYGFPSQAKAFIPLGSMNGYQTSTKDGDLSTGLPSQFMRQSTHSSYLMMSLKNRMRGAPRKDCLTPSLILCSLLEVECMAHSLKGLPNFFLGTI